MRKISWHSVQRRASDVRYQKAFPFPFRRKADANDVSRNKQGASGLCEGIISEGAITSSTVAEKHVRENSAASRIFSGLICAV